MPLPPGIRLAPGTQLDVKWEAWPTGWRRGVVSAAWFEGAGNDRCTLHRIRFEQLALRPDAIDQFDHDLSQVETRFPVSAASEVFGIEELLLNIHEHLLSRDTQALRQVNHPCAQAGVLALERHEVVYTHGDRPTFADDTCTCTCTCACLGGRARIPDESGDRARIAALSTATLNGGVYAPHIAGHVISRRPCGSPRSAQAVAFGGRGSGPGQLIDPVGVVAHGGQLVVADMGDSLPP